MYLENSTRCVTTPIYDEIQVHSNIDIFGIVIIWVITCVTILGNFLVISSFIRDKIIRSKPANVFVLVLSIADTTVGIVSLPFANIWVMNGKWIFGKIICKINLFLDFSACAISSWCILLLSLDRYWMVKKHLKYKAFMTHYKAKVMSAIVVLFFTSFYGINVFFWELISTDEIDYTEECMLAAGYNLIYNIVVIAFEFLLILVLLIYLNIHVLRAVADWSTGKSLKVSLNSTLKESKTNTCRASTHLRDEELRVMSLKKNDVYIRRFQSTHQKEIRKAATMLGAIVLGFVICYTPYYMVVIFDELNVVEINDTVLTIVDYFLWFNSCLNPILYAATNKRFLNNFFNIMCCGEQSKVNKKLRKATNHTTSSQ